MRAPSDPTLRPQPAARRRFFHGDAQFIAVRCVEHQKAAAPRSDKFSADSSIIPAGFIKGIDYRIAHVQSTFMNPYQTHEDFQIKYLKVNLISPN